MNKWVIGIVTMVIVLAGIIYAIYQLNDYDFNDVEKSYEIVESWELPSELNEVSGMVYNEDGLMICVQDEDGILFTFDMETKEIIKTIIMRHSINQTKSRSCFMNTEANAERSLFSKRRKY